jgi:hypothetical protein
MLEGGKGNAIYNFRRKGINQEVTGGIIRQTSALQIEEFIGF